MKKYRVAIIGCGYRAYEQAEAYQYVTRGELVACCDLNHEAVDKFSTRFSIPGYNSIDDMLRIEKPDLVHLVTPPSVRVSLMQLISDAGVPACIVEKPVALGVEDWKAISALEATTKTKFAVNHQFRYHADLLRCQQALQSGGLGKPLFAECSSRMNVANQGTHILDYITALLGDSPVVEVMGSINGVGQDTSHPAPLTTVAHMTFANGVHGLFNVGPQAPKALDDDAIYKHCREAVYAENGRVLYEEFNRWEVVGPSGKQSGTADQWKELNDQAQAKLDETMFDWLESGIVSPSNLKRALEQWNVILAIYASAISHNPIAIPFDPPSDLMSVVGKELNW